MPPFEFDKQNIVVRQRLPANVPGFYLFHRNNWLVINVADSIPRSVGTFDTITSPCVPTERP